MAGKKFKKILSITASILTMTLILSQSTFAFDAESNKNEQAALQKQAEQYERTLKMIFPKSKHMQKLFKEKSKPLANK